jgi:phosphopantothenoylcysteine decarboxylase/phosphopantothenate--cysteine ligase
MGTPHALLWARSQLGLLHVRVVMTPMAQRLVARSSLEAAIDGEVIAGWDDVSGGAAPHVRLAMWPDVILVLPATANFLGKLAHGLADDVLSSVVLAADCPVVIAPTMNPRMWSKPAVQRNIDQLRTDGYEILAPGKGLSLDSGEEEAGSVEDVRRPMILALSRATTLSRSDHDDAAIREAGA